MFGLRLSGLSQERTRETMKKRFKEQPGEPSEKEKDSLSAPELLVTQYEGGTTREGHATEDTQAEEALFHEVDYPYSLSEVVSLPNEEDEFHLIDYLMGHAPEERQT
jgi:hypothetical protein